MSNMKYRAAFPDPALFTIIAVCTLAPCATADEAAPQQSTPSSSGSQSAAVTDSSQQPSHDAADLEPPRQWRASFTTWAWLFGMSGDMGVGDRSVDVSVNFLDVLEASDSLFAISGRLELGYGRFGGFLDATYADVVAENQSGPLEIANVDVEFEMAVVDFGLSLRFAEWEQVSSSTGRTRYATLDGYAGGRYFWTSTEIDPKNVDTRSSSRDWIDPIIGAKLVVPVEDRWSVSLNADVGGFGVSSDLTWSTTAVLGYDFSLFDMPATIFLGYRAIGFDYSTGSGNSELELDVVLHGPLLGLSLSF